MIIFTYEKHNSRMNPKPTSWSFSKAASPLLISVPHAGTLIEESVMKRLNHSAHHMIDTDWHMDEIAAEAAGSNASVLAALYSRYMIDLNRPANDQPLYQGATTGLVPSIDFDGNSLYREGQTPQADEIKQRIQDFWQSYHNQLGQVIEDKKQEYGFCLLLDCHSIRSQVPRLFEGALPDINIGTNNGLSASTELSNRIEKLCQQSNYSYIVNGRFKGGYITRNYAKPAEGVHAVQIEIAQHCYMIEQSPWTLNRKKAAQLVSFISLILEQMQQFADKLSEQRKNT